ncbi:hypothetical protein [Lutibacter sp.]|uniref:hypothetical protein n=1 Tax=Lutibacter sp. TaxID=1925666 RepID=UPI003565C63B
MKRYKGFYFFLIIILQFMFSCSDNNEDALKCKLTSCEVSALFYPEINQPISYNPNFSNKIYFEYNNQDQIIKVLGGLVRISDGANFYNYAFVNNVEATVSYVNNTITNGNSTYLILENGKLISRKTINPMYGIEVEYNYEYHENKILELSDNRLIRTFYLINDNLTRIEEIFHNNNGEVIVGKRDIIFSNYDTSKNLLKGLFFIHGAFYKAFSNNNYKTVELNSYDYENNNYILRETNYSLNFNFDVNSEGIPDLFEQDCN